MSNIRRIPIAPNAFQFFVAGPVRPVAVYENGSRVEGAQARDDAGVPVWSVDLGTFTEDGLAVCKVKFPSATEPVLEMQKPADVRDLVMSTYAANGGGVGQSFTASAVHTPAAVKQG